MNVSTGETPRQTIGGDRHGQRSLCSFATGYRPKYVRDDSYAAEQRIAQA